MAVLGEERFWRAVVARPKPTQRLLKNSVTEGGRRVCEPSQFKLTVSGESEMRFEAIATCCNGCVGLERGGVSLLLRNLIEDCEEARETN